MLDTNTTTKTTATKLGGFFGNEQGVRDALASAIKLTKEGYNITDTIVVGKSIELYGYKVEVVEEQFPVVEEAVVGDSDKQLESPIPVDIDHPDFSKVEDMTTTAEIEAYMAGYGVNITSTAKLATAKKQARNKWEKLLAEK